MKCNSCGEEIREDAQFCGFCGAQQGEEPVEVVVPVEESVTADMQPPMEEMTPDAEAVTTEEPMTEIPVLEVAHPVQPEPETPAEPEPMPVIVPAVEPQPEPEPAPEPIPEPVAAPAPQPVVAPAPQPVVAPAPQPAQQPVVAPAPQPVQQPVVAPVPQPVQQPVVAPAPQPVYQAPPQPVYQAPQPVYQAPPQPVYQAPQPVYQAPPQPVYQAPQPVYQAPPQPVYQAPPQPVYQAPRPQYQPAPQYQAPRPQYQPAPAQQRPAIQLPTGRGLIKLWLLTLITLGIYPLVMWSRMSVEINMVASRYDGKRTTHFLWMPVLSGLTLGIYMFVWLHKLCNRIGNELKRRNVAYKFSAATFWLWTFVYGIVGGVVTGVVGVLLTYLEIDPMIISVVTGVLGLASSVGAAVFGHKILKAMNLMNKDYNEKG